MLIRTVWWWYILTRWVNCWKYRVQIFWRRRKSVMINSRGMWSVRGCFGTVCYGYCWREVCCCTSQERILPSTLLERRGWDHLTNHPQRGQSFHWTHWIKTTYGPFCNRLMVSPSPFFLPLLYTTKPRYRYDWPSSRPEGTRVGRGKRMISKDTSLTGSMSEHQAYHCWSNVYWCGLLAANLKKSCSRFALLMSFLCKMFPSNFVPLMLISRHSRPSKTYLHSHQPFNISTWNCWVWLTSRFPLKEQPVSKWIS